MLLAGRGRGRGQGQGQGRGPGRNRGNRWPEIRKRCGILGGGSSVLLLPVLVFLSSAVVSRGVGSPVLELGEETFASALRANPLLLVKFYAPWCGHCKQLAPEYEKAAQALQGRALLAQVDATTEVGLAEQYRIEGYPTLYFFKAGRAEEYGGGRSNASIVSWVEEHSGPALVSLASESALETALGRRQSSSYFVARGGAGLKELFGRLAEERRTLASFYYLPRTSGDSAGHPSDVPEVSDVVQVHRGFNEVVELELRADATSTWPEAVLAFLESEVLPPFGEISEENYAAYLARATSGILWLCFQPETYREDARKHQGVFQRIAASFPQFPVVFTNTKLYEEHVREELGCTEYPMAVLQLGNFTDEEAETDPKRYKLFLEEITEDNIGNWIKSALGGTAQEDDGLDELDEEEETEEEDEEGEEDGSENPGGKAGEEL